MFGGHIQPIIAEVAEVLALRGALLLSPVAQERADALESFNLRSRREWRVSVKGVNVDGVRLFEFRQHLQQRVNPPLGTPGFPLLRVTQRVGLLAVPHDAFERRAALVFGDDVFVQILLPQWAVLVGIQRIDVQADDGVMRSAFVHQPLQALDRGRVLRSFQAMIDFAPGRVLRVVPVKLPAD